MCDAVNIPFDFPNLNLTDFDSDTFLRDSFDIDDLDTDDEIGIQKLKFFNLRNPKSNLDPDELALYIMVIILATAQFILIIRYFMRLQVYFDRLQAEITKKLDAHMADMIKEEEERLKRTSNRPENIEKKLAELR